MPKVSIIVPVYNAEKYLRECVDSLLAQTLTDIQIILVNDGSADSSPEICREYEKNDARVVVIDKQNEGAGRARADGVLRADAPFITFIDSDDRAAPSFCEELLLAQQVHGADIVECGYYVLNGSVKKTHLFFEKSVVLDREEFKQKVIKNTIIGGTEAVLLWNKLYRKDLFVKQVGSYGCNVLEDYLINMQYYLGVSRYAYVAQPLVYYRVVSGSLSRRFNPNLFDSLSPILKAKAEYMQLYGMASEEHAAIHSAWLIRYAENYLKGGVGEPGFKEVACRVLSLTEVREAAECVVDGRLAALIRTKDYKKAISYLKGQRRRDVFKRRLYRIKNAILNKVGGKK